MKPIQNVEAAARALGVQLVIVKARSEDEFNSAFKTAKQEGAQALLVISHGLFINSRKKLIEVTNQFGLPSIYEWREISQEGGLISYGTNINDMFRIMGTYAGRILKGAKPSDLPVVQPTKFELVINLKTAKALGLTIPPALLARRRGDRMRGAPPTCGSTRPSALEGRATRNGHSRWVARENADSMTRCSGGWLKTRPITEDAMAKRQAESVYRIVDVVGESSTSWEDAGRRAVETAATSIRDLRLAEVVKMDMKVENGKVTAFRTRVALSFKYEA